MEITLFVTIKFFPIAAIWLANTNKLRNELTLLSSPISSHREQTYKEILSLNFLRANKRIDRKLSSFHLKQM